VAWSNYLTIFFVFFFQAEDGIRDGHVTGVQTCALPISGTRSPSPARPRPAPAPRKDSPAPPATASRSTPTPACDRARTSPDRGRSEERRVGKECRSRWAPDHDKKKSEMKR